MTKEESPEIFDQQRAATYDEQRSKLAPMRDALNFLIRMVLADLPTDANVLCIGVGTGSELLYLAQEFPEWQFTAVEPAEAMLNICRQRTHDAGIESRCTFHHGVLETLPVSSKFDAATCIFVSQFIMEVELRQLFFKNIANRLATNGIVVSADLASDMNTLNYERLFDVWLTTMRYSDMPAIEIDKFRGSFGHEVAVVPPHEIESIIASSGFESPGFQKWANITTKNMGL